MGFDQFETSDGRPIELITFTAGAITERVTNGVRAIQVGANTFQPLAYTLSSFTQSKDTDDNNRTMRVPGTFAIVSLFTGPLTSTRVMVQVERFHLNDPAEELQIQWKGSIVSLQRVEDEAEVLLQPLTAGAEPVLRTTFGSQCQVFLFESPGCDLAQDDFRFVATLNAISSNGLELTCTGLRAQAAALDAANGGPTGPLTDAELDIYWQGGHIRTGAGEIRDIVEGNVGDNPDVIRINQPLRSIAVLDGLSVFAGCDHSLATCHKKFDNAINFQGTPYVPEVDPANTELPPGTRTSSGNFSGQ